MTGKPSFGNPVPISDLATGVLDPVLRKRAGLSVALLQSWEEVVGPRIAARSRPERLQWPRQIGDDDAFSPATLVIACDGMSALHIQHETAEIIGRVNAFLGFAAVGRVRIVQKPVVAAGPPPRPKPRALSENERAKVSEKVAGIEDPALREALERLGSSVIGSRKRGLSRI
jgi:Uncharacterized protein conserved in bacteria